MLLFVAIGVLLFSCSNSDELMHEDISLEMGDVDKSRGGDEFAIDLFTVEDLANGVLLDDNTDGAKSGNLSTSKVVKDIFEVPDKNQQTAFYIVNYEGGGFLILAGDRRSEPVLAYSQTNEFVIDPDNFPSSLVAWLYDVTLGIETLRESSERPTPEIERQWEDVRRGGPEIISHEYNNQIANPDCVTTKIQKGPYLQTTWGQWSGYNEATPFLNCSQSSNGRAPTGCVATAMAQVMKYHKHPSRYSWDNMPNSYGTIYTSLLMREIGSSVNMDYSCGGSGAIMIKCAPAFKNYFGYSSARYGDYKYQTVIHELNNARPVILSGGRKAYWFIFPYYTDGHAWVCDGYYRYSNPCYGTTLRFHMNWGWGSGSNNCNGWFAANNFNPGNYTFNFKTKIIYDIRP